MRCFTKEETKEIEKKNREHARKGKKSLDRELRPLDVSDKNIKLRALQYKKEREESKRRFVNLKTEYLHNIYKLPGNCIKVLLYLQAHVNRNDGRLILPVTKNVRKRQVWGNLDRDYREGFLATARTQKRIMIDTKIDQGQVSRAIKTLVELNYLKIPRVQAVIGKTGRKFNLTVFYLGVVIEGEEIFFYELGESMPIEYEEE